MVAAKAIALAMRSIAAVTAATTSNVVLGLTYSFPSALVAFHAKSTINALLEVAHTPNCTFLDELLRTPLARTSVK
jgi:hypothetical protein